jgi:hypothetical protein
LWLNNGHACGCVRSTPTMPNVSAQMGLKERIGSAPGAGEVRG